MAGLKTIIFNTKFGLIVGINDFRAQKSFDIWNF